LIVSEYEFEDGTARITLDDGKVNALGSATINDLNAQLDRALADQASAIILIGREKFLSAGFDLDEIRSGEAAQQNLRRLLIDLVLRLFTFERPVVIACTGHALAAGAALLLAADRRIGLDGRFKLGFNEASLGVPISAATVELARYRMPMPYFESLISGDTFPPDVAPNAGLLDQVVADPTALLEECQRVATQLAAIPPSTFATMRHEVRGAMAERLLAERRRLFPTD
jgi:enoyl-CoA hydratase